MFRMCASIFQTGTGDKNTRPCRQPVPPILELQADSLAVSKDNGYFRIGRQRLQQCVRTPSGNHSPSPKNTTRRPYRRGYARHAGALKQSTHPHKSRYWPCQGRGGKSPKHDKEACLRLPRTPRRPPAGIPKILRMPLVPSSPAQR